MRSLVEMLSGLPTVFFWPREEELIKPWLSQHYFVLKETFKGVKTMPGSLPKVIAANPMRLIVYSTPCLDQHHSELSCLHFEIHDKF